MNAKVLQKITYGLYVISSQENEKFNGQIANTLVQVASEPPVVAVSISIKNLTHEFLQKSKKFSVSILSQETPLSFIGHFGFKSGRTLDKFVDVNYKLGKTGVPIVTDNTLAYLEALVIKEIDAGSHTIFMGRVEDMALLKEGDPLTYAYYKQVKGGTTPKTAPTFSVGKEKKEGGLIMAKYRCTVCGYIYDPEIGDPDSGIQAGTPFEQLPDDWVCPVCGATKDQFEKMENQEVKS